MFFGVTLSPIIRQSTETEQTLSQTPYKKATGHAFNKYLYNICKMYFEYYQIYQR